MDQSIGNGHYGGESDARLPSKHTSWTEILTEEPIAWMVIAVAAGFVLGGGARRSGGLAILTMLGQLVVREVLGESASLSDLFGNATERPT